MQLPCPQRGGALPPTVDLLPRDNAVDNPVTTTGRTVCIGTNRMLVHKCLEWCWGVPLMYAKEHEYQSPYRPYYKFALFLISIFGIAEAYIWLTPF